MIIGLWGLIIAFSFGLLAATDTCLPQTSADDLQILDPGAISATFLDGSSLLEGRGTPENFLIAVSEEYVTTETIKVNEEDLAFFREAMVSYITDCRMDPMSSVAAAQQKITSAIEYVDEILAFLAKAENMKGVCGPSNRIDEYVTDMNDIRRLFGTIHKSMFEIYDAISCPRVHNLYKQVVHQSVCSSIALGVTHGVLDLSFTCVCVMVLISLRSAWRISM
eukprot:jgi/Psemu1/315465/fgenesh1_kg.2146_\